MFPSVCSAPPKDLLRKFWQVALYTNAWMRLVEGMLENISTSRPRIPQASCTSDIDA